jgi:L,D-peptidoglycan transpeptidase YkuD (ErfK/YbiS/YcfS/YnhG family)
VLKAVPSQSKPAARHGRRFFLFLLAGLAMAWGCQPESEGANKQAVRTAAQRAIAKTRAPLPGTASYLEVLLRSAEGISAAERASSPWARDSEREAAAWHRLARASWDGARRVEMRDRATRERWSELEPLIQQQVAQAQESLREGAGLGPREGAAIKRAEYHAFLATNLAKTGDLDAAVEAAEKAITFTDVVDSGWNALRARFDDRKLLKQWRAWANQTILESKQRGTPAIIVDKLRRELHVYDAGKRVATFPAELGGNGLRPKRHAGDRATPEGRYKVLEMRANGATKYYKALLLDYPNRDDVARFQQAKRRGAIPSRVGIGSLIEVHGLGGDGRDWTDGCVALSNNDMDKVFKRTRVGTPVVIVGTL